MAAKNSPVYRVVWRRAGDWDTFEHGVAASDGEEARAESARQIQEALGPNAQLWHIAEVIQVEPSGALGLRYPVIL